MNQSVKTIIAIVLGMVLGFVLAIIMIDVNYNVFGMQAPGSIILLMPLVGAGIGAWIVNRKEKNR